MWEPFRLSLQAHLPHARIVYDKFHVLRHASEAVDETRQVRSSSARGRKPAGSSAASAGCYCGAGRIWTGRSGKRCALFALNRRLAKAYLLKEQLIPLWVQPRLMPLRK